MVNLTLNVLESDKFFDKIADELDISPSLYKAAVDRYTAIGDWLDEINLDAVFDGSAEPVPTDKIEADIFTQGSFALGTVVKPWSDGENQEYDIDLVFQLRLPVGTKQPHALKKAVGQRLEAHRTYSEMLEKEGRRCWTIVYAEQGGTQFHLDILPALDGDSSSEGLYRDKEIGISDRIEPGNYKWLTSNPRGYAEWFKGRHRRVFDMVAGFERKRVFAMDEAVYATVHKVPDLLVRTPLQRAIQILKRHRDMHFSGLPNEKDKPISIIITTLAALLYDNEESISATLENIVNKLVSYKSLSADGHACDGRQGLIERTADGGWLIKNPVCPEENFADKWHLDSHARAKGFFQWIEQLEQDLTVLMKPGDIAGKRASVKACFGLHVASAVLPPSVNLPSLVVHNQTHGDIIVDSPAKPWRQG